MIGPSHEHRSSPQAPDMNTDWVLMNQAGPMDAVGSLSFDSHDQDVLAPPAPHSISDGTSYAAQVGCGLFAQHIDVKSREGSRHGALEMKNLLVILLSLHHLLNGDDSTLHLQPTTSNCKQASACAEVASLHRRA